MKVAVIGAGASGLMAAYAAAQNGNDVTIYEKNEKCGKKIYITGKGRCNVTNNVPVADFFTNVVTNPKFLISCVNALSPEKTMELFESLGLKLKTERGGRVFPVSDKASDVTACLEKACKKSGVKMLFNAKIDKISILDSSVRSIISGKIVKNYDKVIVCTGGLTYPATGSTGDGYKFAEECGHTVTEPRQALCGLNIINCSKELQGLSLKNINLSVYYCGKKIRDFFGEMLFTHFGVSGPTVLSASSIITRLDLKKTELFLDLKPALTEEQLDKRLLRDFEQFGAKSIANCLKNLLPNAIIPVILTRSGISADKKANSLTKPERSALVNNIKKFGMRVASLRDFCEAIITSGGVDVNKINPKTMESKLINGLYFCGEVLDVDAFTGGFNMQIAFSTGYAAGNSIR